MNNRFSRIPFDERTSEQLKTVKKSSPDRFLTSGQRNAYDRLIAMAGLIGSQNTYGDFVPRIKPLLVGPTGVGKSTVITMISEALGTGDTPLPMISVNAGAWIVAGAKAEPTTLAVIRSFVRRNPSGIIFLDELDKVSAHGAAAWRDPWSITVTSEVIAFLDGKCLSTAGWRSEEMGRLRSSFWIIGAGAWQRAHRQAQREAKTHEEVLKSEVSIPEEIAARFNRRLINIAPPNRNDFRAALRRLYSELRLPASESLLDVVTDAAVAAEVGMRFVEDHLTDLLMRNPKLHRKSAPVETQKSDKRTIPLAAFEVELKQVYSYMEQSEMSVALLRIKIQFHASELFGKIRGDGFQDAPGKFSLQKVQDGCDSLLAALRLRFARSHSERQKLHEAFWESAHTVTSFAWSHLEENAAYLKKHKMIHLFTHVYVRVSRALNSWEYVCSLNQEDVT